MKNKLLANNKIFLNVQPRILPSVISLVCIIYFFKTLFTCSLYPTKPTFLNDGDTYWIIKTGDWIIKHKQIPFNNILGGSFNDLTNIKITNYQWLYEVFISLINKFLGFHGLIWFSAALLTLTLGILGYTLYLRKFRGFPDIFLALIGIFNLLFSYTNIRPFTATLFLGALLGLLITKIKSQKVNLIILPVLFMIWANIHLGFVFGLGWLFVECLFLAKEQASYKPFLTWGLCFLATLINPYGFKLYFYLINLGSSPFMNSNIYELKSINFQEQPIFIVWIITGILAFAYTWDSKRIRLAERIMWLVSLSMLFFSLRHLCFVLFFMPVIFASAIEKLVNTRSKLAQRWNAYTLNIDNIFLWITISVLLGLYLTFNKTFAVPELPKYTSINFLNYIKNKNIEKPILSNGSVGSELIYFSNIRSYLDTRYDMYGDKYVEKYSKLLYQRGNWKKTLKQSNITHILYEVSEVDNYYFETLSKLGWKELYKDKKVILWGRE